MRHANHACAERQADGLVSRVGQSAGIVPEPLAKPGGLGTPPLTAADLPELDVAALFGPTAKLTGTDDTVPGDADRIAVLGLTSERFGVAAECIGDGSATVEVTRPIADPSPGGSMYEELASYSLDCPSGGPVVLELTSAIPGRPRPST